MDFIMKKIVDERPGLLLCETAETMIGQSAEYPALFCVRSGISAEEAMVHAALYLKCAASTSLKTVEANAQECRGLAWSTVHSVEMASALISAVLTGMRSSNPNES